ncbi:MAG: hypothetical protein M3O70_03410, partial [Actinomycetota bacterium]|nr:hypothetical protein [Actinomycetota bacterium]
MTVRTALVTALVVNGRLGDALAQGQALAPLVDGQRQARLLAQGAAAHLFCGDLKARQLADLAQKLSQQIHDPEALSLALATRAWITTLAGDEHAGAQQAREAFRIASAEGGAEHLRAVAMLAFCWDRAGQRTLAEDRLEQGLAAAERVGSVMDMAWQRPVLG